MYEGEVWWKVFPNKNIVMLGAQGLTSSFLSCVSSIIMDFGGG